MLRQKEPFCYFGSKKATLLIILIVLVILIILIKKFTKPVHEPSNASTNNNFSTEDAINNNISNYHPSLSWKTENPQLLEITAKSAIVIDESTGNVIYSKNEHESLAPASITKIMTAIITTEEIDKNKLCSVSEKAAATEPNKIVLNPGEQIRAEDLLYGLMMISANDAAEVLAEAVDGGRQAFIDKMNKKVQLLGLEDTYFMNPSGLDEEGHYSSAFDIGVMTRFAIQNYPEILKYMGEKDDYSVYPTDHNESHWWSHISSLLYNYPGTDGVKTGYTENADHTLIATAIRDGKRIIIVYFGSTDSTGDAVKLLDLGFSTNTGV